MRIDLSQLDFIEPLLRDIVIGLEKKYGVEFMITSLYRIGDKGVHGQLPLRGIDLRCWDKSLGEMIEEEINTLYVYDPERPNMSVCMFHDIGQGAHLHLQVHPNTRIR
jgi:hypothetical protein